MLLVVGVRLKTTGKIYYFSPGSFELELGGGVIVETIRGLEYGEVVSGPRQVMASELVVPLKEIIRLATENDLKEMDQNEVKEKEAFAICEQKIAKHKLDMKLVNVEYGLQGSKITFYFTADGRVDFRDLVKDLASVFRARIELRQIGVRDESRMVGGLGICGRVICCKQFLNDFHPVSIKMAKEQNLSLSPTKISGACGRLMCCLKYEYDNYVEVRKHMPRIGQTVKTPAGMGITINCHPITEIVRVRMTSKEGSAEIFDFPISEVEILPMNRRQMDEDMVEEDAISEGSEEMDLKSLEE